MKKLILISCLLAMAITTNAQQGDFPILSGPYFGQKPPGMTAQIFAPNIISTELTEHGTVTFSPDGKEVFWSVIYTDPFRKKIMTMKQEDKGWSVPKIASFSLGENEGNPFFSPDGKRVFFTGWRSAEGYAGSKHLIMYAEKAEEGWSEPGLLDPIINSISRYWHISVARNGNFYFYSDKDGGGIYYSKYMNKYYTSPEKLNLSYKGGTPFIAPDESYIIFSAKQDEGFGEIDLYISFRKKDNTWTIGKNLGPLINSDQDDLWPIVSPDGKFLFFTSARTGNMDIFWISASFIDELKPKELK